MTKVPYDGWRLKFVCFRSKKRIEPMNYGAMKNVGSIKVSGQMTTYPSPKSQLTLTSH